MCWKAGSGRDVSDVEFHISSADILVSSTTLLWKEGRMACWRARVNAAEAGKAEVASVEAVLMPMPPFLTGSVACSQWVSSKSTLKIDVSPVLGWSKIETEEDGLGSRKFSGCLSCSWEVPMRRERVIVSTY